MAVQCPIVRQKKFVLYNMLTMPTVCFARNNGGTQETLIILHINGVHRNNE